MKTFSHRTPFSLHIAFSQKHLNAYIHNMTEIIIVRQMETPVLLLALTLVFCFFGANLVSCTLTKRTEDFNPANSSNTAILTPPGEISSSSQIATVLTEFTTDAAWESAPTLDYNDRWTFYVEETPADDLSQFPRGVSSRLAALDKLDGEIHYLTDSFSTGLPNYRLYPFTDILGCDGFILEYPVGAVSSPVLFFRVEGNEVELLADCDGFVYTGDLDGNGVKEVVYSTYGAFSSTFIFWIGENGVPISASFDDAAKELLTQIETEFPSDVLVTLEIQDGSSLVTVRWINPLISEFKSQELDVGVIFQQILDRYRHLS